MATKNSIDSNIPIEVTKGGTGSTALTNHAVLVGATTSTTSLGVGSTGQLLVGASAADPAFASSATGDFTFTTSTAGATRTLTISNTDNSNTASNALDLITVGGGSAGDPFTTYTITGATSFSVGLDNSDSDKYKISASTALGTTDTFVMTTGGQLTLPLQAVFLATLNNTASSVTGDGTAYLILFDTKSFDIGTNYNTGTGNFTAPVTGKYLFVVQGVLSGLTSSFTSSTITFTTSAKNFTADYKSPGAMRDSSNRTSFSASFIVSMTAADTASATIAVSGNTKTINVLGSASTLTYFCGTLLG